MIKILHNTMCSKSCAAVELLRESGEKIEIQEYLQQVPSHAQLRDILDMLGIPALELIRQKEPLFLANFKDAYHTDQQWIDIMIQNPILIERPIVIKGDRAIIGRPIEKIVELLEKR